MEKKKTKTEKVNDFEINNEKVKELVEEGKKRRLVFLGKDGETIMSLVLLWAIILSIVLWPLVVVAIVLVLATGGSVRVEKK